MKITHTFTPTNRAAWRAWLARHHRTSREIWVVLYKKHLKKTTLSYDAAVEEALCFGWIDGQLRRIDDEKHMLRFSPRKPGSTWAPSNIARVKRLIREKRMTKAGLDIFKSARLETQTAPTVKTVMKKSQRMFIPKDLRAALVANRKAWMHFQNYPPSFRLLAIHWVTTAKKPETRVRRIQNVVANAVQHAKPAF